MQRRDRDRSIDSDPATQGALSVPKVLEATGDPDGLHEDDDGLERALDREARTDDDATVHAHEKPGHEHPDPLYPEELAADAIALATQGGGSFLDEDLQPSLEEHVDREALAAGIVPQLVGQATLESASASEEEVLEPSELEPSEEVGDERDAEREGARAQGERERGEEAGPRGRARPGRTGVHRVSRRGARS